MLFRWLKHYMPRGLYGRAALILVLPIVALQLLVSVVFIQRHFEDVTTQMTQTIVREMRLLEQQATGATTQTEALERIEPLLGTLQMQVRFVAPEAVPVRNQLAWYDFSGRIVIRTMQAALPGSGPMLLPDTRRAVLYLQTDLGPVEVTFGRRRVSAAAPHQLPLTMVVFGMLMTVIAYLYLRNQLRPITKLATAAEAFGRGRNVPYWPSGALEVRAAGSAFLSMRARIERQIEQRTLMLSGVSHDLRTPLTRLKLGLAMLDDDDAAPLREDVDEMQRLLDAFLDFAKGASEGEAEPCDPQDLVARIVADAQRAGKPVTLAETEGTGQMDLRTLAIRRAVENLIGNAVRYGNRAEVSVMLSDKALRIRVEDDGPGIPADLRSEAIKPFARLDPARNQNAGSGVGLGLAITADVARAHGGVLRLGDSTRLGGLQADLVIGR